MGRQTLSAEQFSGAGPSPTNEDAFITVSHLADGVAHNHKHGANHLNRALNLFDRLPPEVRQQVNGVVGGKQTIEWHLQHAAKHAIEAGEHAAKLSKHVRGHPAFRQASADLRFTDPGLHGGI